ncbi:MAG: transglycosylase SLT domain-containing protein [Sporichthyaceae bacterium]|nr:transglycosylase SLT domain-containing protein [Sporichthyaceae bacterium]
MLILAIATAGSPDILWYRVKPGDTVSEIAQKHGVKPADVIARNDLADPDLLIIGRTLKIPTKVEPSTPTKTYPKAVREAAVRNRALLAKHKTPTKAQTEKMIRVIARDFGVPRSLALAVGWMESGWNQKAVSPANAIGVMQVLPSTGRWLETKIGRDLDLLDAKDNITAGVAYLKILTREAPVRTAIAGYYQGPGSVRKNGMYPRTKRYVKTVLALRQRFAT